MSGVIFEDFEKNQYGVIRGGLSGQYGDMPEELHLSKLEQTCMYEREDQLDSFFRSTLKDRTPDAPDLASDLPRESQNHARSAILNLRHSGALTPAEPIHPDLFLGFTDRDTRGYHDAGPDFKLYADQSKARGRYKDFLSDHASDWTVPESHRSEMRVISDIRKTIEPMRERMAIFDTSEDNRATTYSTHKAGSNRVVQTTSDGTIIDLNDAQEVNQRKDNTHLRSDLIMAGYRQTGDHKFATAHYGIQSVARHRANIAEAQYKNTVSHKYDVKPDEVKNRLFLSIMQEVGRRKHLDAYKTEMGGDFKDSANNKNIIKRLLGDLSTAQNSVDQTAETIDLGYLGANIKKVRVYDPVAHDMVEVDKDLFDKINEHKNITFVKKFDNAARRNINAVDGKAGVGGDEVQVYIYARKQHDRPTHLPTKLEHEWSETLFAPLYKQNHARPTGLNDSYTLQDQGIHPSTDRVFDRYHRAGGQHWQARSALDAEVFSDAPVGETITPASGRSRSRRHAQ